MILQIAFPDLALFVSLDDGLNSLMAAEDHNDSLGVDQPPQLFDVYGVAPLPDADPKIVLRLQ